jgi:cytochrome c oxidase accessory protein FixG
MAAGEAIGDCVDCNACVAVCPMGIDIRDGQQLECITCALCIDACDSVMDKIGKERGLISYATLSDYQANMALATGGGAHAINPALMRDANGRLSDKLRQLDLRHLFRPRTLVYFGIWALIGAGLLYALLTRDRLDINVLQDRNPQYVEMADGSIRNGYTIKLLNMIPEPRTITLSLVGLEGAIMSINGIDEPDGRSFSIPVEPDRLRSLKVFVRLPVEDVRQLADAHATFRFRAEDRAGTEADDYVATFNTPGTTQ